MNTNSKMNHFIAYGLIIGSLIGTFLDMYEIAVFGAAGLGIVYMPMAGLLIGAVIGRFSNRKNEETNSK